jgi:nicotinamide riboside transporter PnuC
MVESALYWVTSLAALVGVWLNIRQHVACFWIWLVTNSIWAVADFRHGIYAQGTLQAIYALLSVYGIVKWSRRDGR